MAETAFPVMSIAQCNALMTAPGARFELERRLIDYRYTADAVTERTCRACPFICATPSSTILAARRRDSIRAR